jgi:hypothetical protein
MGRGRCSCSWLTRVSAWIGVSIGMMSLFPIVAAPLISGRQVLGSLGSMYILASSSRGVEIVGVLNNLALWGRKSLSS